MYSKIKLSLTLHKLYNTASWSFSVKPDFQAQGRKTKDSVHPEQLMCQTLRITLRTSQPVLGTTPKISWII